MKKRICLALCVLLLAGLLGCGKKPGEPAAPVQPFLFYYRSARTEFTDENSLICPELRDLGEKTYSDEELFRLYLLGPLSRDFSSPFPKDASLLSAERSGSQITFHLRERYESTTGINDSIADACLARTALQLEGVRKVRIRVESTGGKLLRDRLFTENDLLLYDNGEFNENTELLLYFSDPEHRFLLMEKRTVPLTQTAELPRLVIEELLKGPDNAGMQRTLPEGTVCWGVSVENGVCFVDFNADFFLNRPEEERAEQLTVLSVVNSLCELDEINQVQIYAEGRRLDRYTYLDLSAPFSPDGGAVGPVREEMNEFSADLCLPDTSMDALHRLTVRIRVRGAMAREEALLIALFEHASQNGLVNPLENAPAPESIQIEGGTCVVRFRDQSFLSEDAQLRTCQLRSLIATLCSLPEVSQVEILAGNTPLQLDEASEDWFVSAPETPQTGETP